jgi:hypothetical protein
MQAVEGGVVEDGRPVPDAKLYESIHDSGVWQEQWIKTWTVSIWDAGLRRERGREGGAGPHSEKSVLGGKLRLAPCG